MPRFLFLNKLEVVRHKTSSLWTRIVRKLGGPGNKSGNVREKVIYSISRHVLRLGMGIPCI